MHSDNMPNFRTFTYFALGTLEIYQTFTITFFILIAYLGLTETDQRTAELHAKLLYL